MTVFHISYDAKDSEDCENLRREIPIALLKGFPCIRDLTEPVRSTFRFVADVGKDGQLEILSVMREFAERCYYFASAADAYEKEGKSYFPSLTFANEGLDNNFQLMIKDEIAKSKDCQG